MYKAIFNKLQKEISGQIAYNYVSEISRYHRIQASPGYRAAAHYAAATLQTQRLKANILEYPADGETHFWSALMHEEWDVKDAELKLIEPKEDAKTLARFEANKISLIQRSHPTPKEGVEAELVLLNKGEEQTEYESLDLTGKIVLTNGDVSRVYSLAVAKHGAIGIIYDGIRAIPPVRPEHDLDDALAYTSFWWTKEMKPAFGFVISPRDGSTLRRLAEKLEKEGKKIKLHAWVDSSLYPGKIENVSATIEGETNEEVIVTAHLCHPQPSANDNASGSGAVMEAARALQALIARGVLAKPKRTIRFLLVPEMTGTYAYLASNEDSIRRIVAAINLDMVGENQTLCGGPLICESPPEATSSYVSDLLQCLFDELKNEAKNLSGSATYALFKHAVTPYSGGSDHAIYSDPTVGVACPMIIQWPDKFYHTSWDTIDKVDPEMLRKVALLTATYAYFISNAGKNEALWLNNEVVSRYKSEIATLVQREVTALLENEGEPKATLKSLSVAMMKLREKVDYRRERATERLLSTRRLVEPEKADSHLLALSLLINEVREATNKEYARAERAIDFLFPGATLSPKPEPEPRTELETQSRIVIPKKLYRGPISLREYQLKLSTEEQEEMRKLQETHPEGRSLSSLALYWTDGKRNLYDIAKLTELETGKKDLEYLVLYYEKLRKMGLIEINGPT